MYKKNDSSPKPLFACVISASTGDPITSGVACKHYQADGTETECDNSEDHEGNGTWRYVPSQAETNETTFAVKFYHADAVGDGPLVQVITTVPDPDDLATATDVTGAHSTTDGKLDTLLTGAPTTKYMGPRGPGIYIDSGAANENTTTGTDGIISNPVSTFAAARTIADAIGVTRYYLEGNSDITLAATHVDWEFIGVGSVADNIVNLGSQDVSRSLFVDLTIEGVQGGAGRMEAIECALQDPGAGATTLHIFALRCGLVDDIEIDTSNNNVFDSCYSLVAGAGTPSIIATGAAGTLEVRHYSGGLEIKALSASHNVSIEGMGQIVFNANCNVNANVSIRGLFTITDNTAGMASLTQDAVVNMPKINAEADTALSDYAGSTHNAAGVKTAIEADGSKVDHLWEMTEDDSGTRRLTANALEEAPDVALTTAGQQDIAQIIRGTKGVVYFVATDGSDGNDGLSPDTAKLTSKTVIEAASANDVVILGPGLFALAATTIDVPDSVSVVGAGMGATRVTCTATNEVAMSPGNGSLISDMSIEAADDNKITPPIGAWTGDGAFINAVGRRLRLKGYKDVVYLREGTCDLTLIDCVLEGNADVVRVWEDANTVVNLVSCRIVVDGKDTVGSINGVFVLAGTVYVIDCHTTSYAGTSYTRGVFVSGATATAYVHGGSISVSGSGTNNLAAHQEASGVLIMCGVDYDRSKTNGTITEISSAESALVAKKLDHLVAVAESDDPVDNSILAKMASTDGDWSNFSLTTDSLQSIRDLVAALNNVSNANVLTQVNAALDAAISELSVGIPTATPSLRTGMMLGYMALRDQFIVQTSGTDALEIYNDAGTLIAKKLISDDDSDYTEAKMVSGA